MKCIKKVLLLAIILIAVSISKAYATTGTVNTDGVRVRKGPSTDDEIIQTLNKSAEVEIIGESGDWYKIKYDVDTTFEGYMHKDYIDIKSSEPATPTETPAPAETPTETPEVPGTPASEPPKVDLLGEKSLSNEAKVYILPVITSSIKDTVSKNTKVTVIEVAGNYAYIKYNNKNGWVKSSLLQETTTQTTTTTTTTARTAYVCVSQAIVRKSATTESEKITTLTYNDEVTVIGEEGNFYKIRLNDNEYYMAKHLIANTKQPVTTTSRSSTSRQTSTAPDDTQTQKTESKPQVQQTVAKSSVGDKMAQMARSYVGYKYVYGGSNPSTGFDCSGLVYYICGQLGYSVNRTADNQIYNGVAVDKANLQPGDLVFFTNYKTNKGIGHVGIYIGNNQFVHASTPTTGVIVSSLSDASYVNRYVGARRIGV